MPASGLPADPGPVSDWKAAELQQGVAWLDERTSERFIPQMLGFDRIGAVSFNKGCYPGQEIVARARYLGKVKRGPLQLRLEAETDAAKRSPAGLETGAVVALVTGDDRLDATVVDHVRLPDGRALLFLVAPLQGADAKAVEIDGRSYRCATM
jgi:folate-binding protein YgfZ